jgi:hypothetical protein
MYDARNLVNIADYPIHIDGDKRDAVLKTVRENLAMDGCAVLKNFLTPEGIEALTQEADAVAGNAHRSYNRTNVYFTADDKTLPTNDPRRRFYDRSNAFIPADNFQTDGALRTIHDFNGFDRFIQDCFQEDAFYRYADPLADVIINMAPGIRKGSENFSEVGRVLDGTSKLIKVLELEPGDLQLFRGRYSLHRVTPLIGPTPRYVAIFSYVEQPDMVGSPERTEQLYGRTLPIHWERAGNRKDAYID